MFTSLTYKPLVRYAHTTVLLFGERSSARHNYVYIILFYKPWHLWRHADERPLIYHWLSCDKWITRSDDLNVVFSHTLEKTTSSAQSSAWSGMRTNPSKYHTMALHLGGSSSERYNNGVYIIDLQAMVRLRAKSSEDHMIVLVICRAQQ